ncbi:MAG: response regulator [Oscillospiraceae bacterium]|nr:response regulator [Oscillospiraceae bacterium]
MTKILIVDDERFEREQLCQIIEEEFLHEVQTRTAENGRQAVETAALWTPGIVFMDIEMPGVNGIEAAKRILTQLPSCKLIFVTAYSLFNYAYEAVKMGAYDYILKPVDPDDVIRAVRRCIDQANTEEELKAMAPVAETLGDSASYDKTTLLMSNVKKYLQHNYMLYGVSLDSISDILKINSSYFSMMFKKSFGVNFVDYLTNLRINAAKELLADPFLAAAEIANMVGYESPNYFTRVFKKTTGMTPTEFRKLHMSAGKDGSE